LRHWVLSPGQSHAHEWTVVPRVARLRLELRPNALRGRNATLTPASLNFSCVNFTMTIGAHDIALCYLFQQSFFIALVNQCGNISFFIVTIVMKVETARFTFWTMFAL